MEVRDQDSLSLNYTSTSNQPNQESLPGNRRRNETTVPIQTLDHHLHILNNQEHTQRGRRDPDPDPYPDPDPAQPVTASDSKATTAAAALAANTSISNPLIRYRECLKNHAASMGGHVVDGCGEYMPSGEDGTPEGLKCAACGCHRNFHRKEIDGDPHPARTCHYAYNPSGQNNHHQQRMTTIHSSQPPPPAASLPSHHRHRYSHGGLGTNSPPPTIPMGPVMMAFGGGPAAESSSEDLNVFQPNAGAELTARHQASLSASKKRFRTKFSQEQKDRMHEFAEILGWRIQKQDEHQVNQFCSQTGVRRKVFKVWMHNNKQAIMKKKVE